MAVVRRGRKNARMNVLLVDDRAMVLGTLAAVTSQAFEGVTLRVASSLEHAVQEAREADQLDLVLLDLSLPGCEGIDALVRFRAEFPALRVLVFSARDHNETVTAALEAGAVGYLPKTLSLPAIAAAIRLLGEGGTYVPPGALRHSATAIDAPKSLPRLTERETEVMRMLARGLSNRDIANELDIAESTVKQHMYSVFRALGVSSRVEAIVCMARLGIRLD